MSTRSDLTFAGRHAWHWTAPDERLAGPRGRPVVVMAHGLGGTKDSGLEPFAETFAAAGLDVLAFDYRGFGSSDGEPRQRVSIAAQRDDYLAALATAAALPGVDPARLVLWGVSLAGGHVLHVAAGRDDVAAVVALTPLVSGVAAGRLALAHHAPSSLLRSTATGFVSRLGRRRTMPLVGRPGEVAALSLEGHLEDYTAIAGPTWRNEVDAAVGLELGAVRVSGAGVTAPALVQVADFDRSAPLQAAMRAAFAARAEVRHYPGDHFDVWPGKPWFEAVAAHQAAFLTRHLTVAADPTAAVP